MSNRLTKQHFWQWFKRHNKEFLLLHKKTKKEARYWLNEWNTHLRAYGRYMKFAILWEQEKNTAILIITSYDNSRFFKKIEAFVARACEIPNWKIQALEPPTEPGFLIEERFGHTGIDEEDFRFVQGDETEDIICVYHPLYTEERYDIFKQVAAAVLYNILGERAFGLDIGYIEVDNVIAGT